MAIAIELVVNGNKTAPGRYFTWAPTPCSLRVTNADGATTPIAVVVRNQFPARGGQLVFRAKATDAAADQLELELAPGGAPTTFVAAGKFQSPSTADLDAFIQVRTKVGDRAITSVPVMVRIRKNATSLTTAERDRLLSALASINSPRGGVFQAFRDSHRDATASQAHGGPWFLPWHRAFVLDLERELQKVNASVALPYWRFDQPAPKLFRSDYMGAADNQGFLTFTPANPLRNWITDGQQGLVRGPFFNPASSAAHSASGQSVLGETGTTSHPGDMRTLPNPLEINPHGRAHVSFGGFIHDIDTAARDPLFYMLHCNVDRLWAKWQWLKKRHDITKTSSYPYLDKATGPTDPTSGYHLQDTMWPWNNVRGDPRPNVAPRQPFPKSAVVAAPGQKPTVGNMIDYQGHGDARRQLGFDYDDVPYEQ